MVVGTLWAGMVSISVTNNPSAEWIAGQVTHAFPWDEAPRHLIHDRDSVFGPAFTYRIREWGFGIILSHRARRGRTGRLSGSSDRSVANHSTTSWCSAKRTFATIWYPIMSSSEPKPDGGLCGLPPVRSKDDLNNDQYAHYVHASSLIAGCSHKKLHDFSQWCGGCST